MPGPPPKRRRQRHDAGVPIAVIPVTTAVPAPVEVPEPPAGLLAQTQRDWAAYWSSPLAQVALPATDLPAIRRLFALRDDVERMSRAIRRRPLVEGYRGQARPHPMTSLLVATLTEVRNLEDRFGLTPMSRLRLGVTFGEAARSLADLNAEFADISAGADDDDLLDTLRKETP